MGRLAVLYNGDAESYVFAIAGCEDGAPRSRLRNVISIE
jgi:hypothetical protein